MSKLMRAPQVQFAFMALGFDPETEGKLFTFDVSGTAPAHAIINLKADHAKGDRSHVAILQHEVQGEFNVLACSVRGKSVSYSFTHVEDRLRLGEHLLELGVSAKTIAAFNELKPEQAIPLRDAAIEHEAAADLTRIIKGVISAVKGPSSKPE